MRICQRRKSLELSLGLQNCLSDFKRGKVILRGGSKQNCERTQCGLETETASSLWCGIWAEELRIAEIGLENRLVRPEGNALQTLCPYCNWAILLLSCRNAL